MKDKFIKTQRAKDLLRLARTLYEAGIHEQDGKRLEMLRLVAVELKQAIDEATETDGMLHPDLGLELLLFLELKESGNEEAEGYRKTVDSILAASEQRV